MLGEEMQDMPPSEAPDKLGRKEAENLSAICNYLATLAMLGKLFYSRINTTGMWDEGLGAYRAVSPHVVKGFADVIVILPGRTIFLEVKSSIGKQRPEQRIFQYKVEQQGCEYYIVRSTDFLRRVIEGTKQRDKSLPF